MDDLIIRAWHKEDKVMFFPRMLEVGEFCEYEASTGKPIYGYEGDGIPHYPNNCELMRPIGLTDKNGDEIFENDIVEVIFGTESKYVNYKGDSAIENQIEIPMVFSLGFLGINSEIPSWGNIIMRPYMTMREYKKMKGRRHSQFNPYGNCWEREIVGNKFEGITKYKKKNNEEKEKKERHKEA